MFMAEPRPERFCKLSMASISDGADRPMMSIGLQIITENMDGLKINPTKMIVFALGTEQAPETNIFDIPPSFARALAERLVEFADAAESQSVA